MEQESEGWNTRLRELWLDCLSLLWPTVCVGCGFQDRDLCTRCFRELSEGEALSFDPGGVGVPCFAAGPYEGITRAALIAYKHQGMFGLSRPLGRRLVVPLRVACGEAAYVGAAYVGAAHVGASHVGAPHSGASRELPIIVTLPSRAKRVRERGYQHIEQLVKVALREVSVQQMPVRHLPMQHLPVLRPLRGRTGQVGLDVEAREENARRVAVRKLWVPDLAHRDVILVDDIVTTGATIRAAQEVLEAAGARVIAVVALCVAARRDTPKIGSGNRT